MNEENKVVTRFAPSPTGVLHIGGARTALFNYLFAKKYNGQFILRIEDTDKERSKPEFESEIQESLSWLSLEWDAYYKQSDRTDVYKKAIVELLEKEKAYVSKEEKEGGRDQVIRFKNPNKDITFQDRIREEIRFDTSDLGDFVIAKTEAEPLYHLTVVVDDQDMGISDVIRAEEHISNTPRQILILEALGYKRPNYAHIPLILAPDRSKLSKRHGAVSVMEYQEKGYLPEALVNYLALLGWNPGNDQEIFKMTELIQAFSLENVQKGGSIFDEEKLRFINKTHLKKFTPQEQKLSEFKKRISRSKRYQERGWQVSEEYLRALWEIFNERVSVYEDIDAMLEEGEFDHFFERPEYKEPEKLLWKGQQEEEAREHLETVIKKLRLIDDSSWHRDNIKEAVWDYAEEKGRGNVLWPMRYSLSGRDRSPDPIELASTLGKTETLKRLETAHESLTSSS